VVGVVGRFELVLVFSDRVPTGTQQDAVVVDADGDLGLVRSVHLCLLA
jgi:hypothetical protein